MLKINCKKTATEIERFIRQEVRSGFNKKGAVVGLSGGLDSSVTATLCSRAIGPKNVLGIILPESESAGKSSNYAMALAKRLGIRVEKRDITPVLDSFGIYKERDSIVKKYFRDFRAGGQFRITMPGSILTTRQLNVPCLEMKDSRGRLHKDMLSAEDYRSMIAATNVKHRVRMSALYYYAEKNNYLVAGTTNLTEFLLGFFVKYGDGGADIDPIRHLYKTQVYQLARYLKLPDAIIDRTPSPDTFSYPVSDEDFYFRLPYSKLDMLLYSLINKMPLTKTRKSVKVGKEQLERIFFDLRSKYKIGERLRNGPIGLERSHTKIERKGHI